MNPLRTIRKRAGLSYRKGAALLGISLTSLQRYEDPDFRPEKLPLELLEAMRDVYGCESIDELVGRTKAQAC